MALNFISGSCWTKRELGSLPACLKFSGWVCMELTFFYFLNVWFNLLGMPIEPWVFLYGKGFEWKIASFTKQICYIILCLELGLCVSTNWSASSKLLSLCVDLLTHSFWIRLMSAETAICVFFYFLTLLYVLTLYFSIFMCEHMHYVFMCVCDISECMCIWLHVCGHMCG